MSERLPQIVFAAGMALVMAWGVIQIEKDSGTVLSVGATVPTVKTARMPEEIPPAKPVVESVEIPPASETELPPPANVSAPPAEGEKPKKLLEGNFRDMPGLTADTVTAALRERMKADGFTEQASDKGFLIFTQPNNDRIARAWFWSNKLLNRLTFQAQERQGCVRLVNRTEVVSNVGSATEKVNDVTARAASDMKEFLQEIEVAAKKMETADKK